MSYTHCVLYCNKVTAVALARSILYLKLMALAARSLLHSAVSGNGNVKYGLSFSCSVNSNL